MTKEQLPVSLDNLFRQKFQLDNDQLALISDKLILTKKTFISNKATLQNQKRFWLKVLFGISTLTIT
jgi:hypothetical protein